MEYKVTPEIKIDFENIEPLALNALKLFRNLEKRYKIIGMMSALIEFREREEAGRIVYKLLIENNNRIRGCKTEKLSYKIKKIDKNG